MQLENYTKVLFLVQSTEAEYCTAGIEKNILLLRKYTLKFLGVKFNNVCNILSNIKEKSHHGSV